MSGRREARPLHLPQHHDTKENTVQNSSEFQYIAIDTIHESATNPRRTFDECKLGELPHYVPGHIICIMFRKRSCGRCGFPPHG
jgi:hypothetical protein